MSGTRLLKWSDHDAGVVPLSLHRCAAATMLVLLSGAALVVFFRWLAGALLNPLQPVALVVTTILTVTAAATIRVAWSHRASAPSRLDWGVMASTSAAAFVLIAALCLPGAPLPSVVVAVIALAAEETWAWAWYIHRLPHSKQEPSPRRAEKAGPTFRIDSAHEEADTKTPDPFSAEVTQQLTRSLAADGAEQLFGWLRLPFASGQRTGSVHVAFCPPLSVTPEVSVEQIDGPEARIKTAQLLPHGARFDLKLAEVAESATTVVVQFMAKTPPRE